MESKRRRKRSNPLNRSDDDFRKAQTGTGNKVNVVIGIAGVGEEHLDILSVIADKMMDETSRKAGNRRCGYSIRNPGRKVKLSGRIQSAKMTCN